MRHGDGPFLSTFSPQNAAVPAEHAVLEAVFPKLKKVFFKNLKL